jgi:hypothetical protein
MTPFVQPLSRREALRRVIGVSLALSALEVNSLGAAGARGIGTDPNLLKKEIPWPRILSDAEKKSVTTLADLLLPADDLGPAASAVGVPDFIDEWVSAPYAEQQEDRETLQKGLAWLDAESKKRHGKIFAEVARDQQTALLDEIVKEGSEARKAAFAFFTTFRELASGGYFSTPEGWSAIGYVGNKPIAEFPGPPPEVLKHLGLG